MNGESYENLKHLMRAIKTATDLTKVSRQFNEITGVLVLLFGEKNKGITFSDKVTSRILGFGGIKGLSGTHLGCKTIDLFDNLTMSDGEAKSFVADYPFDLLAGKQLMIVCKVIIEYQHIGGTKAPLIRFFNSRQCLKKVAFVKLNQRIE